MGPQAEELSPEGRSLLGEVKVREVSVNKRWLTDESWPREYMCKSREVG